MRTPAWIVGLAMVAHSPLCAQDADLYFAQRCLALMDPSRTGFERGPAAALISRQQWMQLPAQYRTSALAVDVGLAARDRRSGRWGVGGRLLNDRSGDPAVISFQAAALLARHQRVSQRGHLSFGVATAFEQRACTTADGRWGSQYDGNQYDPSLPSNEGFGTDRSLGIHVEAGLSYTWLEPRSFTGGESLPRLIVGASIARLVQAEVASPASGSMLPGRRITSHATFVLPLSNGLFDNMYFETAAQHMGAHHTARLQVSVGREPIKARRLSDHTRPMGYRVGVGCRLHDTFMVSAALTWKTLSFGSLMGWALPGGERTLAGRRTLEVFVGLRVA